MILYERIKTGVLIFLVVLSIVLTLKLWTFQPEYALLAGSEYVATVPLSEERKLESLLLPEQIILHLQEDTSLYVPSNHQIFPRIYKGMIDANYTLASFNLELEEALKQAKAIELIFPTEIPKDVVLSLFEKQEEELLLPKKISRFQLLLNEMESTVFLQLISYEEQRSVYLKSDISTVEFLAYMEFELPEALAMKQREQDEVRLAPTFYIPNEALTFPSKSYTSSFISGSYFKELFFSEPSSVKYYRQEYGEESYTDGNRLLQVNDNGNFLDFINPVYSDKVERGSKHIIISSLEYVNGHGGWTDHFVLDSWGNSSIKEEVTYRLVLNGLPVMYTSGLNSMTIMVERTGTQVSRYVRPLFDLDPYPFDTKERVLPSGSEIMERLEASDLFDINRVERMIIGYEMRKLNSILTVEPTWFMLYGGVWHKVPDEWKREGEIHGLE